MTTERFKAVVLVVLLALNVAVVGSVVADREIQSDGRITYDDFEGYNESDVPYGWGGGSVQVDTLTGNNSYLLPEDTSNINSNATVDPYDAEIQGRIVFVEDSISFGVSDSTGNAIDVYTVNAANDYTRYSGVGDDSGDEPALDENSVYNFRIELEGTESRMKVWEMGTEEPDGWDITATNRDSGIDEGHLTAYVSISSTENYLDYYEITVPDAVTGTVQNPDGGAIQGANVSFTNQDTGEVTSTLTDTDGNFEAMIDNGTYDIEITHNQYITHTEARTIQPGDDLGTFELHPSGVRLETGSRMDPNSTMNYRVSEWTGDEWISVPLDDENLTVTSDNISVATVDPAEGLIRSEAGVNTTVNITAEYTQNGTQYNYTQEIAVATLTIDNLDILPAAYWPTTILKDGVMQWVGMGLMVGMVFCRIARNPWVGLGIAEFVLSFGWFLGFVGTGVFLASIFYVVAASVLIADVYRPQR